MCFMNLFEIKSKYDHLFIKLKLKYNDFISNKPLMLLPFKYLLSDSMIFSYIDSSEKINKIHNVMEEYINNYVNIVPNRMNNDLTIKKQNKYNFIRNKLDKLFIQNNEYSFNKEKINNIIDKIYNYE